MRQNERQAAVRKQFNRSAAGAYDAHAHVQRDMARRLAAAGASAVAGAARVTGAALTTDAPAPDRHAPGLYAPDSNSSASFAPDSSMLGSAVPEAVRTSQTMTGRPLAKGTGPLDVLEIGCGTGMLTALLLEGLPADRITALDIAPAMIDAARQRINESFAGRTISAAADAGTAEAGAGGMTGAPASRVRFLAADAEAWSQQASAASFDLIVSGACFQWLRDPLGTLRELRRLLRPGGRLAFTTFGPQTFRELHASFAAAYASLGLPPQRHGLSLRSGGEWLDMLEQAGFAGLQSERWLAAERHESAKHFLHSVKAVGASATEAAPPPGVSARRLFVRMFEAYDSRYRTADGGVAATYECLLLQGVAR